MTRAARSSRPIYTGLLGGSFNPAHGGHRHISIETMRRLDLDELWWMVSPGNPLKPKAGMAPLAARLASAQARARGTRIRATAIESALGTRYTIDTMRALCRRYPRRRFIWLMGADNLGDFHRWKDWRTIARMMPIAVIARPGYDADARAGRAMRWLGRYVHPPGQAHQWTQWKPPALVLLHFLPDNRSATAYRLAHPDWAERFSDTPIYDALAGQWLCNDQIIARTQCIPRNPI